jgi:hypothetical protein
VKKNNKQKTVLLMYKTKTAKQRKILKNSEMPISKIVHQQMKLRHKMKSSKLMNARKS